MKHIYVFAVSIALCVTKLSYATDLPLTVVQVERVTGLTGLSVQPAKYDKHGINFVTTQGQTVLTVKTANADTYEVWKSHPSFEDQASISGIGDDAVSSKTGRYVCYKKAGAGICVVGMPILSGKSSLVGGAQVLELARVAASGR